MGFHLRAEDRRDVLIGFLTLAFIMASHAMLETARDTLFLSSLPAERLPWAYLAIAGAALVVTRLHGKLRQLVWDKRKMLAGYLSVGVLATLTFWVQLEGAGAPGLFGFYVFTGLMATVVVVSFWLLLDDIVTVVQAKRVFGPIAAGGVMGAMVGSFAAERLLTSMAPRHLLLAAAGLMAVAAFIPMLWPAEGTGQPRARGGVMKSDVQRGFLTMCGQPYLRLLFALVLVSTLALTGVDYLFKSMVAQEIPAAELGPFFARVYLVLNAIALVVQLFLSGALLRVLGVSRALLVMPGLLVVFAGGFALAPALLPVLLLKGADGTLRHSLHRTGMEVLYLPLPRHVRDRFKAVIDVLGQRGGQALASLAILGAVTVGAGLRPIAIVVCVLMAVWVVVLIAIRKPYVELFRANLREGAIETRLELAELDLSSLEALLAALDSDLDDEVLAAIDLFEAHDRTDLIPVLILHHPAREVVLRALEAFVEEGELRFVPTARRLLEHGDCALRAGALRAITVVAPDKEMLADKLEDRAAIVQATALVGSLSVGGGDEDLRRRLEACIVDGSEVTRRQLAAAIREAKDPQFNATLTELMRHAEEELTKIEITRAMRANPDAAYLPALLPLLGSGALRPWARRAMMPIGLPALEFLDAQMSEELPRKVRRHLPRTISKLEPRNAARVLVSHYGAEHDGAVRYKILRGLGRIRVENPDLRLDKGELTTHLATTLRRVITLLEWRIAVEAEHRQSPAVDVAGGELLVAALEEKEQNALERVFRLLGLIEAQEDFRLLWNGLRSADKKARAASQEVLTNVLRGGVREAVLALVDDAPDEARLARAAAALEMTLEVQSYEAQLAAMLEDPSEAVRCMAARQIGELGLSSLAPRLESVCPPGGSFMSEVIARALERLRTRPEVSHV